MRQKTHTDAIRRTVLASVASLLLLPSDYSLAQQPKKTDAGSAAPAAADQIADFFSKVGDQIYEDCIFELSEEQVEVQNALAQAYIEHGASSAVARRLAVKQIQPPKLSERCEQIRRLPKTTEATPPSKEAAPPSWDTTIAVAPKPKIAAAPKVAPEPPAPAIVLANKKVLPQWDCAPNVDYVTILGPRRYTLLPQIS